jgi:hypothetical protein
MKNHPSLFDALEQRDEAMAAVDAAAPEEWKDTATLWLIDYLHGHEEFFSDDVWAAGLPEPPEARAFGPIVRRAIRAGHIVATEQTRPRTRGHATPAVVYRSTLYRRAS